MKKKIGIDFDDVLFGFNRAYCLFHNQTYDTNLHYENIIVYDMDKIWGISIEECVERVNKFYLSTHHEEAEPVPGSIEALNILKQDHELHIITSRREDLKGTTIHWLERYFPGVFAGVHFTNQFGGTGIKKLKSEVCKELGIDLFIDDALHNVVDIVSVGIPVILLDTPWNQGKVPELVTRVHSWDEVREVVAKLD
jgi:uncharacterized HAD superfamily protein